MTRKIHSADYAEEMPGVVDFSRFRVGTDKAIEVTTEREFATDAEYSDFMRERLVIEINETTDDKAPTMVFVGVNGEELWLPRGQKVALPRYFVERLARSRSHGYKSVKNPDPGADIGMLNKRSTNSDYAFSVLRDPNPKGRAWLERVVREAA